MVKCAKCGKNLGIFSKKYYIYPGKKKGSLEITDERIICESCFLQMCDKDLEKKKATEGLLLVQNMMEKNYTECFKILESFFDKGNPGDWYTKGNLFGNLGKIEEALKCYDEALFLDTHYIKAWYRKGVALLFLKKYEEAKKCFINVINLSPEIQKKKPLIINGKPQGWILAAMFGAAVALAKQEKSMVKPAEELDNLIKAGLEPEKAVQKVYEQLAKENPFYVWLSAIVADLPPLDHCVQNFGQILKFLEPKEIATISLFGQKH